MYTVKELFPTLQGEGAHAGRAAVFCRFAGCNLWSGREEDRQTAICQFCDTDFVGSDGFGGGKFQTAQALADAIELSWKSTSAGPQQRYVVFTGGEPLLQIDQDLIEAVHAKGFSIAIETNGTIKVPKGIDWVCVSPKAGADLIVLQADEIKLVIPQAGHDALETLLARFEKMDYRNRFLQAMDGPNLKDNIQLAVRLCQKRPLWRLSVQTHKVIGIR
ncbi:7-carboxy-7-deazaguanine synthase [Polynucleobacter sphagniphilus]|jgi:7-carboxy-7-deazaguanine synthase (Cx14CxxC type)|uniref:7-carboxy-7-deazaguanine synthase n=1 Tax=Polynucleobacter sphagniphilus TaxID=1743169 RepID=A0AA43M8E7_9BURK|nr:7-carboxy-7-deazaguanine synthase [Polynucleobacter sphagniphilus]MDF9787332.1 7-carboxy-7-deazaguanine synthase [Polynucleobacter sphagniphilus]MDH6154298.1 7-carboxy-7-deazaguanine synthase [Polynucleobacter sphagniphilus]MDH6240581.1 7-carboxy-7-deazaguanine synthase [Polynucleobacter sphagniphilus]MDH6248136.1 7-carboxy-7-deazaguanine synthase [Polynucleobacter sphagniphilus]MDH6300123.1 7-carboxy-7-deazaguanine synthase [Polynucleobacter sphagniphilus]